jgi:hypothetical protein
MYLSIYNGVNQQLSHKMKKFPEGLEDTPFNKRKKESLFQLFMNQLTIWSIFFISFSNGESLVKPCNENHIGLSLCKINATYDKTFPPNPPMYLHQSVKLWDILDFNTEEQTVTVFLQLFTWWNDTRLTLTSSDSNE